LQFWDEDIANLAQMWSNQCVWEHGFVEFGDEYPQAVNFKRVGTNTMIIYFLSRLEKCYICNAVDDRLLKISALKLFLISLVNFQTVVATFAAKFLDTINKTKILIL